MSLPLKPGLLNKVAQRLKEAGIVCDKREPDVIKVAPAPLYNSWEFVQHFKEALAACITHVLHVPSRCTSVKEEEL